ncbi:MAG: hypothetical protein KME15_28300 [Drouetiella hepatica Uher 2000/2452]|uniref:Uncharacterized protein n=1 Tax=Drouetiella hepatica Uher 2000/2452 TaxID=904376 RepID=A0A951QIU3_9CYAN|nr:hypothetical protein [Drouetiella hepatica Uher 2000/2452]
MIELQQEPSLSDAASIEWGSCEQAEFMSSPRLDWVLGLLWGLVSMSAIFVGGVVALYVSFFTAGQLGFAIEGTNEGAIGVAIFLASVDRKLPKKGVGSG